MMSDIETKIRTAAIAYAPLVAILGNNPFPWWSTQLSQQSPFPAVVVTEISNPATYCFNRRMNTSFTRVQFTLWHNSRAAVVALADALASFLDQFNAVGIPGLPQYSNLIVGQRAGLYPQTQPPKYMEIVDAMIFNNTAV